MQQVKRFRKLQAQAAWDRLLEADGSECSKPSAAVSTWVEVGLAVADCRQQSNRFRLQRGWQHQLQVYRKHKPNSSTAQLKQM